MHHNLELWTFDPFLNKMDNPIFIVSIGMGKSNIIKQVNGAVQLQ